MNQKNYQEFLELLNQEKKMNVLYILWNSLKKEL